MKLMRLKFLHAHEKTNPARLAKLRKQLSCSGVLKKPILVDSKSGVILDGHHRVSILKELGLRFIPAIAIDYENSEIEVKSRVKGKKITKAGIIRAGISNVPFPSKTSRHIYDSGVEINLQLDLLR